MMRRAIVFSLLGLGFAQSVEFISGGRALAGPARKADPCGNESGNDANKLSTCDRRPINSYTINLPAQNSITSTTLTQLNAGTLQITLTGRNFPLGNEQLGKLWLAPDVVSCLTATIPTVPLQTLTATTASSATFTLPAGLNVGEDAQFVCIAPRGVAQWTGLAIARTWDCDATVPAKACSQMPVDATQSLNDQLQMRARTTCCRANNAPDAVGMCVNPNTTACCGSTPYAVGSARCCNPNTVNTNEIVTKIGQACPCTWANAANPLTCPAGEQCCLPTKYPELTGTADPNVRDFTTGNCYNPATRKCCNTGHVYNPGAQQCCAINGLQSLDDQCPCGQDSDCQFGGRSNFACCMQTSPQPRPAILNPTAGITGFSQPMCNIYQAYPSGEAAVPTSCLGRCINVDYQICCNGVACMHAFEKCCNATCCNQFTGSCNRAIVSGSASQFNPNEFRVTYLKCSTIEHMHELKAFWIFVWPTFLLMMTLATLALVIIFANKASSRQYSGLEQTIIAAALLATIFSLSLFFSPVYKYGMVVIFAHLLAILTAGVRVRSLNVLTVLVFTITVVYLFDPFHGNAYLTLAENRRVDGFVVSGVNVAGTIDRETMGIWHSTFRLWKTRDMTITERYCTNYYNYFLLDDNLRDLQRFDNPLESTWGYCNRGWVFALLMFEGFIILFTVLNFFLTIIGLLIRFSAKEKAEAFPALQDIPY